jgi:HD-GYP domain-containing protein (c-di-GMP phosphodiesterase class II)
MRRVSEVATATAKEVRTVGIAGKLMNLGKTLVPVELLIKSADLTDDELESIRQKIRSSTDFLDRVDFDGPVVDSIRQMQERLDGKGKPAGLKEKNILMTARVIAVANAFVGMTSARPYRAPIPFDRACTMLMRQTGTVFDRRPVSALIHYVENRGGWEM